MTDNNKKLRGVTEGKAERRQRLISATHKAIAQYGLNSTTLAKVAKIAGLVAGTVNFHFNGKEELMVEALRTLTDSFSQGLDDAVAAANGDPVLALNNVVDIYFDSELSAYDRMVAWYTFWAERTAHSNYHEVCSASDNRYAEVVEKIVEEILVLGGKQDVMNAEAVAVGVMGVLDQSWQSIIDKDSPERRAYLKVMCFSFLASVFPWAYTMPEQKFKLNP